MSEDRDTAAQRALEEAGAYLEGLIDFEKQRSPARSKFSLDAIRALLDRMGAPERDLSVLHIAGSKGKGSTALFAESLLCAAGARVGVFTSPHLERWTERFRIEGEEVAPERLAAAVARLRPHVEALRDAGGDTVPTFFDATTAIALALFREASVDHAILEVGLGGRLDSTNAISPAVCCITSIELEHTEILGNDLASIAGEKAGIMKPRVPTVCGALAPEALAVLERRATELGCPLTRLGVELEVDVSGDLLDGVRVAIRDGDFKVDASLAVPGEHQAANAAIAVAAVRRLLDATRSDTEMRRLCVAGLAAARLPGRVEVLSRDPWVIVDAAHTAASARALATVLARLALPVDFVLSISSGKDIGAILAALLPHAKSLTLTRAEPTRSLDPVEVAAAARAVRPELESRVVPNPHLALRAAQEGQTPDAALCATGSVYLAGIARRVLRAPAADRVLVTRTSGP